MQTRNLILGAAAALLLGLPVVVAAQQAPVAVKQGDRSAPLMLGGSGKAIPAGSLEVVQVGPGCAMAGKKDSPALADSLGSVLGGVDGAVFSGPCELAAPGGASYYIPAGAAATCTVGADGSVTFTPVRGSIFARGPEIMITVGTGGSITSGPTGRFIGVTGTGSVGPAGGDRWVGFTGETAMDEIQRAFEDLSVFQDIHGTQGAVSTFNAFR